MMVIEKALRMGHLWAKLRQFEIDKVRYLLYWPISGALRVNSKVPRYCPPPKKNKLRNNSAGRSGSLRYITNNALQISQNGGFLISSITNLTK